MKPKIFKSAGEWFLTVGDSMWVCFGGWRGAIGFLGSLYASGDVARAVKS